MKSFAALLLLLPAALTSCAPFVVTDFVQFTPTRGAPVTISFALASESSTTGCSGVSPNPLHQQGNCDDGTFFQFLLNFNLTVSVPGECPPGCVNQGKSLIALR